MHTFYKGIIGCTERKIESHEFDRKKEPYCKQISNTVEFAQVEFNKDMFAVTQSFVLCTLTRHTKIVWYCLSNGWLMSA